MSNDGRAHLTPTGLRRIARTVQEAERGYKNRPPAPARGGRQSWNPGTKRFFCSAGIAARFSTTSPRSGTATLYSWNGSGWDSLGTVTLWNQWATAIPAGSYGRASWDGGDWFAEVWSCTGA